MCAAAGHPLLSGVDAKRRGKHGRAAHTLFVLITLEGRVEIMRTSSDATAILSYPEVAVVAGGVRALSEKLEELAAAVRSVHGGPLGRHPLHQSQRSSGRRT